MEDLTCITSPLTALGRTLLTSICRDGVVRDVSANVESILERPADSVVGQAFEDLIDPPSREAFRCAASRALAHGQQVRVVHDFAWGDGRRRCESVLTPYTSHGSTFVHVASTDVSHFLRRIEVLETAQALFSTVIGGAGELILGLDEEFRVVAASAAVESVLGLMTTEILGRSLTDFVDLSLEELQACDVGRVGRISAQAHRADGTSFPATLVSGRRRFDGGLLHTVVIRDQTDQLERENALEAQALRDSLTGLANRAGLMQFLEGRLDREVVDESLAVLLLDLDGFKAINDTHGHAAGDQLLISVAQRLRHGVREGDLVGRLGGDEFVVVLPQAGSEASVMERASSILQGLRQPYRLDVGRVALTASLGLALYPQDGASASELVELADAAMYRAKRSGRDRVEHCTAASGAPATTPRRAAGREPARA